MLIENIRALREGTIIPKPKAKSEFKIKAWGTRRGEPALVYLIPNHTNPQSPYEKGVTVSEFERAYFEFVINGYLTRKWFNLTLAECAKEGPCNYTTIGGIFELLGMVRYGGHGRYVPR